MEEYVQHPSNLELQGIRPGTCSINTCQHLPCLRDPNHTHSLKSNSEFTPENGWLEYEDVSFWDSLFLGANC